MPDIAAATVQAAREERQGRRRQAMFGSIGGPELIVIFVVALLIFGPRRLAEIGRSVGRGLAEFRRAAADLRDTLDAEVSRPEPPKVPGRAPAPPAGEPPAADGSSDATARDERT
jgi:TatA/E family protein of Tat protein translocase